MAEPRRAITPTSVEAASLAVGFMTALRRAGLSSSPDRAARLAQALMLLPPHTRTELYWTSRVVLVSSMEQLPVFDAVFDAVFGGAADLAETRGDANAPPAMGSEPRTRPTAADRRPTGPTQVEGRRPPAATLPGEEDSADRSEPEREALLLMASAEERLHDMSFAELAADEVAQMRQLVRRIVLSTPERRSRRTGQTPHSSARLDLRRTIRSAERSGGDSIRLVYTRRRPRPRRLVLLADVSGSMEPYTRVFLSLLQGSVAGARAEAFVFSTRLTRLTRQLASRDPDRALAAAAAAAPDWSGGTRLAESLRVFIDEHGRRGLARGAVVVMFSDGWAQDAPELVGAQMARLRRLAYRIVWVNPRKAAVDYQPLVGGMAAAMPYVDSFVSGHSYAALTEVAAAIHDDRRAPQDKRPHSNRKGQRNAT